MKYSVGDVVYATVPYEDGSGSKKRPVIIFKLIPEKQRYVVAECYSDKEHYPKTFGSLIKEGTELYKEMGLRSNTFITTSIKAIYEVYIYEKWGHYKNISSLMDKLRPNVR